MRSLRETSGSLLPISLFAKEKPYGYGVLYSSIRFSYGRQVHGYSGSPAAFEASVDTHPSRMKELRRQWALNGHFKALQPRVVRTRNTPPH